MRTQALVVARPPVALLFSTAVTLFASLGSLHAQASLFDPTFKVGHGANGAVHSIVIQDDGKIIVGGEFTRIAGHERTNLARLNNDGQLDASFPQGTDGPVFRLLKQPDGRILIGGAFTNLQGIARQRIGRLLTNGVVDSSFDAGTNIPASYLSFEPGRFAIVRQADGKVLVTPFAIFLKRLNPDGQLDATFIQTNVFTNWISAVCVRTDGTILLGDYFRPLSNNTPAFLTLIKSNGEVDASFTSPLSKKFSNISDFQGVFSMLELPDSSVVVCGQFSKIGSTNTSFVAKLTSSLTWDASYQADQVGTEWDVTGNLVNAIICQPDGKIVLGGNFFTTRSFANEFERFRLNVVRLDTQGKVDPCFDPELTLGGFIQSGGVSCLARQADGKILAGGNFECYSGSPTERHTSSHLTRLLPQGDCDASRVHLVQKDYPDSPPDYFLLGTCAPGGTNYLQMSTNLVDWQDINDPGHDATPFPYLETVLSYDAVNNQPIDISTNQSKRFFRIRKEY